MANCLVYMLFTLFFFTKTNNYGIGHHQQCNDITHIENISLGKHSISHYNFSYPHFHCIHFDNLSI